MSSFLCILLFLFSFSHYFIILTFYLIISPLYLIILTLYLITSAFLPHHNDLICIFFFQSSLIFFSDFVLSFGRNRLPYLFLYRFTILFSPRNICLSVSFRWRSVCFQPGRSSLNRRGWCPSGCRGMIDSIKHSAVLSPCHSHCLLIHGERNPPVWASVCVSVVTQAPGPHTQEVTGLD